MNVKSFSIKPELYLTMINGKTVNSLINSSSQICFICDTSQNEMNIIFRLFAQKLRILKILSKYGIFPSTFLVRDDEFLLHMSYRLPLQIWQAQGGSKNITNVQMKKYRRNSEQKLALSSIKPNKSFWWQYRQKPEDFFLFPLRYQELLIVIEILSLNFE